MALLAPDRPLGVAGQATVLRDEGPVQLRMESGALKGSLVSPRKPLPDWLAHGVTVDAVTDRAGQAGVLVGGFDGDVPQPPVSEELATKAVAMVRAEQLRPGPVGPRTLRGRWSGTCRFEEDGPRLTLTRTLASYGVLTVTSDPSRGWAWSFEREGSWFAPENATSGHGFERIADVVEAGVIGAMALVQQACAVRDTRRRAAFDPQWASLHPPRAPEPMKDPTAELAARSRPKPAAPEASKAKTEDAKPRRRPRRKPEPKRSRRRGGVDAPIDTPIDKDQALLEAFRQALASERRRP
ncbi:MAG: hypothetical protein AAF211_11275 [Myxococcota bacterium]